MIARKLANLALAGWPAAAEPHVVVVIDDGSSDGTADRARAAEWGRTDVELRVVANRRAAGKAGAIAQGLEELGDGVELVVLTDADVIARPDALLELAGAFEREPALAMACGAQEFVRDLADDGSCAAAAGGEPVPAAGLYDRLTARVRALESRSGRLFSVHGQLLAWRASLGLAPPPGIAADDLALMLQARAKGPVRLVPGARFLERKTPPGAEREAQALRRARAYFQVVWNERFRGGGALDRLQWLFYRRIPGLAPWLGAAGLAALVFLGWAAGGWRLAVAIGMLSGMAFLTPVGRRLIRLLEVIARARRDEGREPMNDRWEMKRT